MKKIICVMLVLLGQQAVMASTLYGRQESSDVVSDVPMYQKMGFEIPKAPPLSWRPIIRRPQTVPPPPPPARPLPAPRPPVSGSSTGQPAYPSYLPGSDYARRS